jgi:hypothetical protein
MKIITFIAFFICASSFAAALNPYLIQPAPAKHKLDGKTDEWNDSSKITLNRWNWRVKTGKDVIYNGDNDISALVNIGWKSGYIVISAFITDDSWNPGNMEKPGEGDALIIQIAPSNPPDNPIAAPYEIVIGSSPTTAFIRLAENKYQQIPTALVGYARGNAILNDDKSNAEEGKKPGEYLTKCWIETAIPVSELPGVVIPKGRINLGIIVRDDDGGGVRGELRWRGNKGELKSADGLAVGKFQTLNEELNGKPLIKSPVVGSGSGRSSSAVAGNKE